MPKILFQMFGVKNADTGAKTRAHYSLDNRCDGRKCVTVYDRDYGHQLPKVFEGVKVEYRNETDMMTDYFDKGSVTIFEEHEIYAEARAQVEKVLAKLKARRQAKVVIVDCEKAGLIGGPFTVQALRPSGKILANYSGVQTMERAKLLASSLAARYDAVQS